MFALSTLKELRTHISEATENGLQAEGVNTSVALMKRLLVDAQDKLRGMAEETAREEIPVSHYSTHRATPEVPARSKMQLTLAQTEKLSQSSTPDGEIGTTATASANQETGRCTEMSAKEDEGLPPRVPETKRPTTLAKRPEPPPIPDGEVRIIRPPSPTAGPSHKSDFVQELENLSGNAGTRLRLENEKLKREVSELRKLVSASGAIAGPSSSSDMPSTSRVTQLEEELAQAKETISTLKADRKKLKAEKLDLLNQMKQLYATLEDKEKELRDFIRTFEQRMRESEESLSQERAERERERWSLLRHARDEAERSLSLAAQLDQKQRELLDCASTHCPLPAPPTVTDGGRSPENGLPRREPHPRDQYNARRQLSSGGCLSDQESIGAGWRGVNGGGPGDRTSGSVDSGLRGSSDRQSTTNLSDSTTDGAPMILVDGFNVDYDTVSIVSSITTPHMYKLTTPKESSSPSLSPLNAHSFSRSLDNSTLSRSVEQLSSPQIEVEPLRRGKLRGSGGSAPSSATTGRTGGSTWGSISRVFARSRHKKHPNSNPQEETVAEIPSDACNRSWSPLTEEGYAEKLRLLREASAIPMERWRAPTVLAWLEIALGMPQYGPKCAQNIKSGKVLLELSDVELEVGLGVQHPMHRKKLRLAIEEHRNPSLMRYPCIGQLGHTWVSSEWLPDLGLPQYSENFATNLVDARMLDHLSKKELEKYLGVTRKFHQASIVHGIHLLRMMKYDRQALAVRRHQCENVDADPLVWTNQRFIRWARNIDLGEYADNLKDSGVHGALVVLEPSLNGDTMATALGIPPSRNMIRRHLAAELEALVLPARAGFEGGYRTIGECRRTTGGSLGRNIGRIQARALPPPPIQEHSPEKDRRTSFRTYSTVRKKFSSWRSSQGSLSKALGLKSRSTTHYGEISSTVHEAVSPTSSESSGTFGSCQARPDSPQSAIVRRRPTHRHRRVKSIGDIDAISTTTVTPV
ncbi:liprin protein kazrin isoform X3 [Rhodnius prolixus]|uniref:liprin protein kazrin isoform X3 n=1 Tax=Rhodnius prolixus TaxID=13249 RepID=UPI003D18D0B8